MTNVHPDLARLEQQYDQLVSAAEAGHITQADAIATLAGLTVNDTAGAVWAINADGDYVRSAFPGAPAQLADPAQFATANLAPQPYLATPGTFPVDHDHTASGPAGGPGGFPAPPTAFPAPPAAAPTPFTNPAAPTFAAPAPTAGGWDNTVHDPLAAPPAGFTPEASYGAPSAVNPLPDVLPAAPNAPAKQPRRTRSIADADAPTSAGAVLAKGRALIAANKALAAIIGAGLTLFVVMSLQSNTAPTTQLPAHPAPSTPGTETSATTDPLPEETPTSAAAAVPSKATAVQVFRALSSARRDLVVGTVATPPSDKDAAKAAALWAGVDKVGLSVTPGAAVAQGQGAVQQWVVADGATEVADVTVTWILAGDTWKLVELPTF